MRLLQSSNSFSASNLACSRRSFFLCVWVPQYREEYSKNGVGGGEGVGVRDWGEVERALTRYDARCPKPGLSLLHVVVFLLIRVKGSKIRKLYFKGPMFNSRARSTFFYDFTHLYHNLLSLQNLIEALQHASDLAPILDALH